MFIHAMHALSYKKIMDSMQSSYKCNKFNTISGINIMIITNFGKIINALNIHKQNTHFQKCIEMLDDEIL